MRRSPTYAVAALVTALTVAGCGAGATRPASAPPTSSAPASQSTSAASGAATVTIASYAYGPSAAMVKAGSKVTFVNHDATAHTATASGAPGFDTGSIKPNGRATVTLTKPGTYRYICQFHPFMKATVTVG